MCLKSHWFIERFPNKKISLDLSVCLCVPVCVMWKHALNKLCSLYKPLKRRKGVKRSSPQRHIQQKCLALQTKKELLHNWCWTLPLETHSPIYALYLSRPLSLSIYPMLTVLLKTVIVQWWDRVILRRRYNKTLFPPEKESERKIDWEREGHGEAPFIYTITFLPSLSAKEKTVGKQVEQPGWGITDLTCPPEEWQSWFL